MALLTVAICSGCSDHAHSGDDHHGEQESSLPPPEAATPVGTEPILSLSGFSEVPAADDPFSDRPNDASACTSWSIEGTYLEVNTGGCPYATLSSPTLRELRPGAKLFLTFWHTALTAPTDGAEAHVEVTLGGETILNERLAIPKAATVYNRELTLTRAIPAGAPAYFHVHNHGANSYRITPVTTLEP